MRWAILSALLVAGCAHQHPPPPEPDPPCYLAVTDQPGKLYLVPVDCERAESIGLSGGFGG